MFSLVNGFIQYWFKRKDFSVLLVGVDGVGKTTFMEAAKSIFTGKESVARDKIVPTTGLNIATLNVGKVDLTLWDLGGEKGHRELVWPNYVREATSFVFVIDSASDDIGFLESIQVFHSLFGSQPKQRANVPVLILVNKQDLYGARTAEEVEMALDLPKYERFLAAWRIQPASAYDKVGVKEGLEWLSTYLDNFAVSPSAASSTNAATPT